MKFCNHAWLVSLFKLQGTPLPEVLCTNAWWDGILRFCDSEIVNLCTLHFAHVLRVKDDYFPRAARKFFQTVLMTSKNLNNFLRKRRAQRENFSTLHLALGTWRMCEQTGCRSQNSPTLHFATVTRVLFPSHSQNRARGFSKHELCTRGHGEHCII